MLDCLIESAKETINDISPDFLPYFNNRIVGLLQDNFKTTQKAGFVNLDMEWTNNNCESFNHVLKQAAEWKAQKLPTLVEMLENVVDAQYQEVRRSLLNMGDFVLEKEFSKYFRSRDVWRTLTQDKRDKHFINFQEHLKDIDSRITRTVDGKPALTPKHGGKKRNQTKRKRAERTTTLSKKIKTELFN